MKDTWELNVPLIMRHNVHVPFKMGIIKEMTNMYFNSNHFIKKILNVLKATSAPYMYNEKKIAC